MAAAWRGLLVVALLLAGFALKGVVTEPPSQPARSEFDTNRAVARLQRILGDQQAHPVDSAADDAVRGRLIAELRSIGLNAQIHEATDCSALPKVRYVSCSHVRNVIAVIPSPRAGPSLLLNAHYDSTPTGPGAADDGLGVAVLLEVGAILKASPPPRPVTLLFNEGEEFGLNGAHAFVHADPIAQRVNSLINIDVRGVSGPALMYETSDPNGAALSIYARAARRPYANSISTDFAKLIPNTTDVVFFKPRGWTLLNYGIIGNETRYHSPGDTVAALDADSLAHVGTEVLAAARAMASDPDPSTAGSGKSVFTDIAGRVLIRLPLAIAGAVLALLLLASGLLCLKQQALGRPLAVVAAVTFGGIAASGFLAFILTILRPGDFWRAYPLLSYCALYAALLLAMAAIHARLGRGIDHRRLRAASCFLIVLLGSAMSLALPGATIFFVIAPTVAILAVACSEQAPRLAVALGITAALLFFLMLAQLLSLIEMLLIDGPLWAVAPLAALAALPALIEVEAHALRPSIVLLAVCSVSLSAAALAMPRASLERPLGFSIDHFSDTAARTSDWAIATKQAPLPPKFPGKWDAGVLSYNGRTRWIMTSSLLEPQVASVRILDNESRSGSRRVRLMLSTGGANTISIRFPKTSRVLALGLPGSALPIPARGEPDKPLLRCTGRSCNGMEIEVLLGETKPLEVELFSTRFGLPREGRPFVLARPGNAIPQYAPDQTITRSVVRL